MSSLPETLTQKNNEIIKWLKEHEGMTLTNHLILKAIDQLELK